MGGRPPHQVPTTGPGTLAMSLLPSTWHAFTSVGDFARGVDAIVTAVAAAPSRRTKVGDYEAGYVPGSRADATEHQRRHEGIPVPDLEWSQLQEAAGAAGLRAALAQTVV